MRFLLGFVSGMVAIVALGRAAQTRAAQTRAVRPVLRSHRKATTAPARQRLNLSRYYFVSLN